MRIFIFFLILPACGTSMIKETVQREWPMPPDPPRISYELSIHSIKDLELPPTFFQKMGHFFFGKEEVPVLVRPFSLSVKEQKLYVGDTGLQVVHVFDLDKKKYRQVFRLQGSYRLLSPVGVTLDSEENLYVSDSQWNRVFVFDDQGKFFRQFIQEGEVGRVAGIVYNPVSNKIFVSDAVNHQLVVYSLDGKRLHTIGSRGGEEGFFNFPTHLSVNEKNGELFVTDSMNFRIQRFDHQGKFLSSFGSLGSTIGTFSKPKGVAVDSLGHVYVVDGLYDTVQIFNSEGALLMNFGKSGIQKGDFWLPAGIAIDSENNIYVADTYNFRVQVFKFLDREGKTLLKTQIKPKVKE